MPHWIGVVGSTCTGSTPLSMLAMKKELHGFLFLCIHVAVSIVMGLWFVTANRALLENNNILTWLRGFQVKIEKFWSFFCSYTAIMKLKLTELVIKLESKSFEMKCPPMGAYKSSLELLVNAFFATKFVNEVPVPKCLKNVLESAICHGQFQWQVRHHLLNRITQKYLEW